MFLDALLRALAAVPLERYARQRHCAPGRGARVSPASSRPGPFEVPARIVRAYRPAW